MIHAVGTALGEIIQNLRRTVRLTLYENRSRRAGMLLGRWTCSARCCKSSFTGSSFPSGWERRKKTASRITCG